MKKRRKKSMRKVLTNILQTLATLSRPFSLFSTSAVLLLIPLYSDAQVPGKSSVIPATVTLIVSDKDQKAAQSAIKHLIWLKDKKNVNAQSVVIISSFDRIIGKDKYTEAALEEIVRINKTGKKGKIEIPKGLSPIKTQITESSLGKALKKTKGSFQGFTYANSILEKHPVENSPTWLVQYLGKLYTLEGFRNPRSLFNEHGGFNKASDENRHDRRPSAIKFVEEDSANNPLASNLAVTYRIESSALNQSLADVIVSTDELPKCSEDKVELVEVEQYSPGSERFDFVYFNAEDSAQLAKANSHEGKVVAYNKHLLRDPNTKQPDEIQGFARLIGINCLPTRFRFIYVGNQRYAEFRQGAEAWSMSGKESTEKKKVKQKKKATKPANESKHRF